MENLPEYIEIELASWWAGLAIVPINAKLHPKELAWILANAEPRVCFASPKLARAVVEGGVPAGCRLIEVRSKDYEELFAAEPHAMRAVEPDRLAWLFYTSGTTGRPKGR